jgi:hypothetical protein
LAGAKRTRYIAGVFRGAFYRFLDEAVRLLVWKGDARACLVLKVDALGDLFLWFSSGIGDVAPEARAFGRRSVILVRPELLDFMTKLGLFDEVWPLDTGAFRYNIAYRLRMLGRLRRYGFARVLQMRAAREFLQEDSITRVVGAEEALSPVGDIHNITAAEARIGDRLYTPMVRLNADHELNRNRAVTVALTGEPPTRYELPDGGNLPQGLTKPYFIIAPGAGWSKRKWPVENFTQIARHLHGFQCVIVGTRDDDVDGAAIAQAIGGLNLCGRLDISDLSSLVRRADLVISNESGVAHMAAYFGIPSVAIVGGGHYGWFMPYPKDWPNLLPPRVAMHRMPCFGCNWRCIYPTQPGMPVPCVSEVDTKNVWAEIEAMLPGIMAVPSAQSS